MPQTYQATIIHFKRYRHKDGAIELRVKLNINGEDVYFYTPILFPDSENSWIDWSKENSHGEPALKFKGGEQLTLEGEIVDLWGGNKELIGKLHK